MIEFLSKLLELLLSANGYNFMVIYQQIGGILYNQFNDHMNLLIFKALIWNFSIF